MTDILLAFLVLEGALGLWFLRPSKIPDKPIVAETPKDQYFYTDETPIQRLNVKVFDSTGTLRFTRPHNHPDLKEIQTPRKDNAYGGWTVVDEVAE